MEQRSDLPSIEFGDGVRGDSRGITEADLGFARDGRTAGVDQPVVRAVSGALLSAIAADLDQPVEPPLAAPPAGASDMDRAYMKHQALVSRNEELRVLVETLTFQQGEDRRGHAAEMLRLTDQVDFLKTENGNIRQQRDTFAEYSIGVKTRMESLTKVMLRSAQATEETIAATMTEIEQFVGARLGALRVLQVSNAETATALVRDALDAAVAQGAVIPISKGSQAA